MFRSHQSREELVPHYEKKRIRDDAIFSLSVQKSGNLLYSFIFEPPFDAFHLGRIQESHELYVPKNDAGRVVRGADEGISVCGCRHMATNVLFTVC